MNTMKQNAEMLKELGNKGYENAQVLGEINMRAMEKMIGRQMDAMSLLMETSLRQMSIAAEAKGYSDVVKGQVALAKELGERVMEESRENVKLASETRDEYRVWLEQGMETLSEKMSKLQPSA